MNFCDALFLKNLLARLVNPAYYSLVLRGAAAPSAPLVLH